MSDKPCPMCGGVGYHNAVPMPRDPTRRITCPNAIIEAKQFLRVRP